MIASSDAVIAFGCPAIFLAVIRLINFKAKLEVLDSLFIFDHFLISFGDIYISGSNIRLDRGLRVIVEFGSEFKGFVEKF